MTWASKSFLHTEDSNNFDTIYRFILMLPLDHERCSNFNLKFSTLEKYILWSKKHSTLFKDH